MQEKLIEELKELIKHPKSPLPEYGTTDELARHYIGGQKSVYDMFYDKITEILSRAEKEAKEEPLAKISTADLIAELERRRPCVQCAQHEYEYCTKCVFGPKKINNNFKEAK